MLAKLITEEKHISVTNAVSSYREYIQDVIDCMWNELTLKYELLEHSTHYDDDVHQHVKDKDEVIDDVHLTPYRLNLAKIGFRLYEDVYLCAVKRMVGIDTCGKKRILSVENLKI